MPNDDFKNEDRTRCQKCGNAMLFVASAPSPVNSVMQTHTFVCVGCSHIKTYALRVKSAGTDAS